MAEEDLFDVVDAVDSGDAVQTGSRTFAAKSKCRKLLCMGSPLLEIRAEVPHKVFEEFGLQPNAVVQVESQHQELLSEIARHGDVTYSATGGALSAGLAVQDLLHADRGVATVDPRNVSPTVSALGGVGRDQLGFQLQDYLREVGIQPLFSEIAGEMTGWTASLRQQRSANVDRTPTLNSGEEKDESLVRLGMVYSAVKYAASNQYKLDHLRFKIWEHVEAAGVVYAEAIFLTVSLESVKIVAEHCAKMGNIFCLNLSAPYLCSYFSDRILAVLPYTDFVFGSELEYMALAAQKENVAQDLDSVATWLAKMPRADGEKERRRHVIVTCGEKPTIIASTWRGFGVKVQRFPVPPVKARNFVRKDGAGDAFAGGFLYGLMHEADVDSCVELALFCASVAVQRTGPGFNFKNKPALSRATS